MSSKENIIEIIIRHLNDEASAEMQSKLQKWLEEDPSHKNEFDELKLLWSETENAALHPFDAEKAWQKVNDRISLPNETKVIRLFPWKKAIAIAASFLIAVSVYYFYTEDSKTNWKEITAMDSNKSIQLTDGSVITLRSGSSLRIPDNYGKKYRKVQLEGEAYFQVHHEEQNPFYLTTAKSVIQDIGTAFLMESNDSVEQVVVTEGKISFSGKGHKNYKINLEAGESAILKKQKPVLKIVESKNILAWKTNKLVFDNTTLTQVALDLEDYYKVSFKFSGDLQANHILVTAQFNNERLPKVIEELNLFTGLSFRIQGTMIFVSK